MLFVLQKYVFVLVSANVISLYVEGVVISSTVFVIYPPFIVNAIFWEEVLLFVICSFIVLELLLVTESFGLLYVVTTSLVSFVDS